MVLASLKIDAQDFREAGKPFDGSLHVYGDDSVSRFSGKVLIRLLHERRILPEDLDAQVGELRRLTTSRIVHVEVDLEQGQGVFQHGVPIGCQGTGRWAVIHRHSLTARTGNGG